MKKIIGIVIFVVFICFWLGACKDNSTDPEENNDIDTAMVYKPNLYLYPESKLEIAIDILFPLGGGLTKSIPEYNDGWNILIDPNGVINNTFTYLFYEYKVPNYHQTEEGWIIKKENLKQFFTANMSESGFNEKEIKDFIDYWIPKFVEFDYYEIYPQYKVTLNKMSIITFSKEPDNFYRLQYLIKGTENYEKKLAAPEIEIAKRNGFYVMEWGVILL